MDRACQVTDGRLISMCGAAASAGVAKGQGIKAALVRKPPQFNGGEDREDG
jgi:hypothetical protein